MGLSYGFYCKDGVKLVKMVLSCGSLGKDGVKLIKMGFCW